MLVSFIIVVGFPSKLIIVFIKLYFNMCIEIQLILEVDHCVQ